MLRSDSNRIRPCDGVGNDDELELELDDEKLDEAKILDDLCLLIFSRKKFVLFNKIKFCLQG